MDIRLSSLAYLRLMIFPRTANCKGSAAGWSAVLEAVSDCGGGIGRARSCPPLCRRAGGAVIRGRSNGFEAVFLQRNLRQNLQRPDWDAVSSGCDTQDCWTEFAGSLSDGDTVKTSAARCGGLAARPFRWRHAFPAGCDVWRDQTAWYRRGDETFVLKASRKVNEPRSQGPQRGGKGVKTGICPHDSSGPNGRRPAPATRQRHIASGGRRYLHAVCSQSLIWNAAGHGRCTQF